MKKNIHFLIMLFFIASCASKNTNSYSKSSSISTEKVTYTGGDGSSYKNAVIINAKNSRTAKKAEYKYLDKKYTDRKWKLVKKILTMYKSTPYYILTVKQKEKEFEVYFDISSFFGTY